MSVSSCCSCGSGDAEAPRVGKTILGGKMWICNWDRGVCVFNLVSVIVWGS